MDRIPNLFSGIALRACPPQYCDLSSLTSFHTICSLDRNILLINQNFKIIQIQFVLPLVPKENIQLCFTVIYFGELKQ